MRTQSFHFPWPNLQPASTGEVDSTNLFATGSGDIHGSWGTWLVVGELDSTNLFASLSCLTHCFPELQYSPYRQSLVLSLSQIIYMIATVPGIIIIWSHYRLWGVVAPVEVTFRALIISARTSVPPTYRVSKSACLLMSYTSVSVSECDKSQVGRNWLMFEKRGIWQRFKTSTEVHCQQKSWK